MPLSTSSARCLSPRFPSTGSSRRWRCSRMLQPLAFLIIVLLILLATPGIVDSTAGNSRHTCYVLQPNIKEIGEYCRELVPKQYDPPAPQLPASISSVFFLWNMHVVAEMECSLARARCTGTCELRVLRCAICRYRVCATNSDDAINKLMRAVEGELLIYTPAVATLRKFDK